MCAVQNHLERPGAVLPARTAARVPGTQQQLSDVIAAFTLLGKLHAMRGLSADTGVDVGTAAARASSLRIKLRRKS